MQNNKQFDIINDFLISANTEENPFISTDKILEWLRYRNSNVNVNIQQIPFSEMADWYLDKNTGNIVHKNNKFFKIEGIDVKTNYGKINEWQQPIINQPEIGILGIITKKINGILYFLMQAKIEPGNINFVQLSPTLQATKSNYTQAHSGKKPEYLEYFLRNNKKVLVDQLQSEQGTRFLKKRNRNIIIEVNEEIPVYEDFCWMTVGQIKKLMTYNNVINMDTRSVISTIPFNLINKNINNDNKDKLIEITNSNSMFLSMIHNKNTINTIDEILQWLTDIKVKYELQVKCIALNKVKWINNNHTIYNDNFSILAANIQIENREVKTWNQPLIKSSREGIIAFLVKKIEGIYYFLVQGVIEPGNFDIVEMGPTVQCIPNIYLNSSENKWPFFLKDITDAKKENILYSSYQSEEGGRFYREQNKNMIIKVGDDFSIKVPSNYRWLTLGQLNYFLKYNNLINIQARSLLGAIKFV
ncbi:MAG: NDP-hexose 2,3-dehydratase family protein [Vallitalea sp.]|jgi:oxidase EvaA|nr:NDP-hexose 2,3-dehydratase family protein [Vallitalea sp.]